MLRLGFFQTQKLLLIGSPELVSFWQFVRGLCMDLKAEGGWREGRKLVREKAKPEKSVDEKLIKKSLDRRSCYLPLQ